MCTLRRGGAAVRAIHRRGAAHRVQRLLRRQTGAREVALPAPQVRHERREAKHEGDAGARETAGTTLGPHRVAGGAMSAPLPTTRRLAPAEEAAQAVHSVEGVSRV